MHKHLRARDDSSIPKDLRRNMMRILGNKTFKVDQENRRRRQKEVQNRPRRTKDLKALIQFVPKVQGPAN